MLRHRSDPKAQRRLRVLHVIDTLGRGGAERLLTILLPVLRERGHVVEVAALWQPYHLATELVREGIVVHKLDLPHRWHIPAALAGLRRLASERQYDIVHGHLFFGGLYTALSPSRLGTKRVVTYHNRWYDVETANLPRRLRRSFHGAVARHCVDAHTAVSQSAADSYRRHLGVRHIDVVPNAFSERSIQKALETSSDKIRARAGVLPGTTLLFLGGRFSREKGHAYAIDALAQLRAEGRQVVLWMVGSGPLEEEVKAHIARVGMQDYAKLFPPVPNPELLQYMMSCDVVVAPSFHEGMPMIVLEAMALGKPLVTSNIQPMAELLTDGNTALLVPPGNAPALASAVSKIMDDSALGLRLASVARERALQEYGAETITTRWERYYLDTLGE